MAVIARLWLDQDYLIAQLWRFCNDCPTMAAVIAELGLFFGGGKKNFRISGYVLFLGRRTAGEIAPPRFWCRAALSLKSAAPKPGWAERLEMP